MEEVGWPNTYIFIYGGSGAGKTTLCLEFAKFSCRREERCLFITTSGLGFLERARSLEVDLSSLIVLEAFDYLDFMRILEVRELPLYDLVIVDSINAFLREPREEVVRATTLLASILRRVNDDFGVPVITTGVVSGSGEGERPTGFKFLKPWIKHAARLERRGEKHVLTLPGVGSTYEFRIEAGGIVWEKC